MRNVEIVLKGTAPSPKANSRGGTDEDRMDADFRSSLDAFVRDSVARGFMLEVESVTAEEPKVEKKAAKKK